MPETELHLPFVSATKQVAAIEQLLLLWPNVGNKTIGRYVKDTLGANLGRVCIQEARENLGIQETTYKDTTLKKKYKAEWCLLSLLEHYGVAGLSTEQLVGKVRSSLKEQFNEDTNTKLITKWVEDLLDRFVSIAHLPSEVQRIVLVIRLELQSAQVLDDNCTNPTDLV